MTKKELGQLNDLKAEIGELEKKIERLRQQGAVITKDRVQASYRDFPYIQGYASVSGVDKTAERRKETAIRNSLRLLESRRAGAEQCERRITEYINTVEDSRVRRIMQYRYVEGYSWKYIAELMHYDKSYPEKVVTRYINRRNRNKK